MGTPSSGPSGCPWWKRASAAAAWASACSRVTVRKARTSPSTASIRSRYATAASVGVSSRRRKRSPSSERLSSVSTNRPSPGACRENAGESDEKGPAARRRPMAAGEAYLLYVEPAVEGANEADGPFSSLSLVLDDLRHSEEVSVWIGRVREHLVPRQGWPRLIVT